MISFDAKNTLLTRKYGFYKYFFIVSHMPTLLGSLDYNSLRINETFNFQV